VSRTQDIRRAINKLMHYDSLPPEEKYGEWMMIAQMIHNGPVEELHEWCERLIDHTTPIKAKLVKE